MYSKRRKRALLDSAQAGGNTLSLWPDVAGYRDIATSVSPIIRLQGECVSALGISKTAEGMVYGVILSRVIGEAMEAMSL